jgi:hypothetical protein
LSKTIEQYDAAMQLCRDIFLKKNQDYGTSWRILRPSSLTDQIFIKAQRIRTIEEKGTQRIDEGRLPEFIGIVNYCIMALIQVDLGANDRLNLASNEIAAIYKAKTDEIRVLMVDKNHDYGDAWRSMRISSFTDLILMKLLRIKSIEGNNGQTIISEGTASGYQDIINYAIFGIIKLNETT